MPKPVDMSSFAPANSLVYLEANRPLEVLQTLQRTEAWQILGANQTTFQVPSQRSWLQALMRATGIGPIDSVILARSQVAVVVTDLTAHEQGETLNVKPEAAVILETHTAERRIRAPLERVLQDLVTKAYGSRQPQRATIDGAHLIEWKNEDGTGQVVATFYGSVVIVGNSRRVVDNCLNVVRRRAPSLKADPDLKQTRAQHSSVTALAFGYVPASESGRLIAVGLPIALGRTPADVEFSKLIDNVTVKLFGSLAWSSRAFKGGIEDRYQISLQPAVVAKLQPNFGFASSSSGLPIPSGFYSMTRYRFAHPLQAWQSLKLTISGHVDALGAVIFTSILKAGLLAYGIEDPEVFLGAVHGDIRTLRLDQQGDRQLLVAPVRDRSTLMELFQTQMGLKKQKSAVIGTSVYENSEGSTGVALNESVVVIGHPSDVQQYYLRVGPSKTNDDLHTRQISYFADPNNASQVITYANDTERVGSFLFAMLKSSDMNASNTSQVEAEIAALPYAVTETTLSDSGINRITRSPLGQFSTLISLFMPNRPFYSSKHSVTPKNDKDYPNQPTHRDNQRRQN
jgi:hypothetical protein